MDEEVEVVIEASMVYRHRQVTRIPKYQYDSMIASLNQRDSSSADRQERAITKMYLDIDKSSVKFELDEVSVCRT